ncbi:hypothetical protein TRFO_03112 [Tritrichomonas foetus]|uniref:Uncharacterized protein n=1 Tax=Tritrichomonas foetus TaxID=1144522 RepID=A0A1J4KS47_9EUKA|nr:hypothetical protein TRFO_03112 [Tritrichomonas foetus]|eukprot:OHT14103.1 hypothetical protein TRFO_03112 [Tritrichomonas foetus]
MNGEKKNESTPHLDDESITSRRFRITRHPRSNTLSTVEAQLLIDAARSDLKKVCNFETQNLHLQLENNRLHEPGLLSKSETKEERNISYQYNSTSSAGSLSQLKNTLPTAGKLTKDMLPKKQHIEPDNENKKKRFNIIHSPRLGNGEKDGEKNGQKETQNNVQLTKNETQNLRNTYQNVIPQSNAMMTSLLYFPTSEADTILSSVIANNTSNTSKSNDNILTNTTIKNDSNMHSNNPIYENNLSLSNRLMINNSRNRFTITRIPKVPTISNLPAIPENNEEIVEISGPNNHTKSEQPQYDPLIDIF